MKLFRHARNVWSGQAIVELMVAMGVLTVGLLALMGLLARSLGLSKVVADDYTATYLAAEGIEVVKNLVDANFVRILNGEEIAWTEGFEDNAYYAVEYDTEWGTFPPKLLSSPPRPEEEKLFLDASSGVYAHQGGSAAAPTNFARHVFVSFPSENEMVVRASVRYLTRGRAEFDVTLEDRFFNWVPFPST